MIGFLSFISKLNCTALPCLLFVISFRCCWVKFPRHYMSFLLSQGNISRLALCLVRIEQKLRRFRKPKFIGLRSGASCKLSISRVSHKPVFIGLNYGSGLHLKLKELLYSQKYSHWIRVLHYCCLLLAASMGKQSNNTGQGSAVTTILSKPRMLFHGCELRFWNMMLMMFYLHLNVYYLPTLIDVVGHYKLWNAVMFWLNTNYVLQCLHPIAYKAWYVQKCRLMRFMLFIISIKKHPILYSL